MGEAHVVSAPDTAAIVRVAGFEKRYRKVMALRGVDLEIEPGELYGLIGPDGAGKSSLMKAVAGVLSYEAGAVEVFGITVDSERAAERVKDRMGFMPQGLGLNLYPDLSVEENVDFFGRLRLVSEAALAERKRRLLAMARLDGFRARPTKHLSGGMKQKLGLVCTLIHEPELVILDEPTTGVDPLSRRDFWAMLAELLHTRGITALVSTAYMDEASRFDRMSLLLDGRVLAHGRPDEILGSVRGRVVELDAAPQAEAFARLADRFPQVDARGSTLRVFVEYAGAEDAVQQVTSALAGIPASVLRIEDPELEDVFAALVRERRPVAPPTVGRAEALRSRPLERAAGAATGDGDAIEAVNLSRDFGAFRAVDRVSFRIRHGEIFGLLGANGAGKTTVIKMLTGILAPTAGTGRVAGIDMRRAGYAIKERIGYMSQAFSLYRDLTVVQNIGLYAAIYGVDGRDTRRRTAWILDMAGLAGHEADQAGSLPMGLRQRLALGCALVHGPQILFLDEPTSGVDPVGRRRFWDILFRLSREEGVTVLVTTHYMTEAEHCDHLALMFAGRVVADASPTGMKQQVEQEAGRLLEIAADPLMVALDRLVERGYRDAMLVGRRIHVFSHDVEGDRRRIPALLAPEIAVAGINPRPLSMENVFVYRVLGLEQQEHSPTGAEAR
jgi:ABC-2 type transport system ATP-binding protein